MKCLFYLLLMILLIIVLFVVGNYFVGYVLCGVCVDLIQSGLYGFLQGSWDIIDWLVELVEWCFYYFCFIVVDSLVICSYVSCVCEFLCVYEQCSGGWICLVEIDLVLFFVDEDVVIVVGLMVLLMEIGEQIFFGFVVCNFIDEVVIIVLFDLVNEVWLEYELLCMIFDIEWVFVLCLVILISLLIFFDNGVFNCFVSELVSCYELVWVECGFDVILDVFVLLVLYLWDLFEVEFYLVDQFVVICGCFLVMLDLMVYMVLCFGLDGLLLLDVDWGLDMGLLMVYWGV